MGRQRLAACAEAYAGEGGEDGTEQAKDGLARSREVTKACAAQSDGCDHQTGECAARAARVGHGAV